MTKCAEVMGEEGGLFTLVVREKFAEGKQRLLALLFSMFKLFQCAVNFPTLLTDYFKVPSVKRYSWHHLLTLFYTGGKRFSTKKNFINSRNTTESESES